MGRLKVGAFLSSFRLDFKGALAKAEEIGLVGLQLSSLPDEIDVEKISSQKAAEITRMFGDHNLTISAVCGDIGGFAVDEEAEGKSRVERTKRIMDNTMMLDVSIVQTHIGFIPEDFNAKTVVIMRKCLEEIGKYGDKIGVYLATETGPEPAARMKKFLDTIQIPTIKVNYDPANLVMNGFDCIGGVYELKDYIIHTHAKDGKKDRTPDGGYDERPLGQGDVIFPHYIKAMDEIGFKGFYVIERESGANPTADIVEAKRFLDQF